MVYIIALISILLGSIAQYFLKIAMSDTTILQRNSLIDIIVKLLSNFPIYAGLTCYGLSMLFWLYVLKHLELSKAYPMVSIGYIFTLLIGNYFLEENIPPVRIIGVIIICIGVFLISKS